MNRRQVTVTVDVDARAGEGVIWDEERVEQIFVDVIDEAVGRVAHVLGDAPAWVICAEASEDGQRNGDAGTEPDKVLVGAGSPTS